MDNGVNPNYEIELNGLLANSFILVKTTQFLAGYTQVSTQRSSENGMLGNCYFIMGDIVLKGLILIIVLLRPTGPWCALGCIGPMIWK